ncbi:marine proteobacterial sortase target protein [Shewanella colwelliana]|uniref:VIT domain-containing protein n=1 Tax=Shewanella colwelliana TaxID=23 RepID=UPI001BC61E5D|nr:VIT domain-containing protein [Shewanella colwelliana]GIU29846.1 marine proteobacterial sortase target protein [Shewanella colwelliana]
MNSEIGLTSLSGEQVALKSVDITATLTGVLSEVEIKQQYKNSSSNNIETVYTFPLPIDAVLTSLEVELNGEVLQGHVTANKAAEENYEDAIVSGDTAVLVNKIADGLYCINLGNLLAEQEAVISIRYAQLHQWQGDSLRFYLPTTIAPKYGKPQKNSIAEHQIPQQSLSASYNLNFSITVDGLLAGAAINSPTHNLAYQVTDQTMRISLKHPQPMDRDFILEIDKPKGYIGEGYWANDGESTVALTSFIPQLDSSQNPAIKYQPRCIKIVVDCSGSMAGDSIEQARIALLQIINLLNAQDYFNIILFGSNHQQLFNESVIADKTNISIAKQKLNVLAANLGGTEMQAALNAAYHSKTLPHLPTDLLLITDGQTWDEDALIANAERSEHRHFVVGVGSAVSEAFLSKLAKVTGGASEFVIPNEQMNKRILQHFKRIKQTRIHNPQLCLSDKYSAPLCFDPLPTHKSTIFLGDTVNLLSHYEGYPPATADFYFEGEFNEAKNEHEMYGSTIAITHKQNDNGLIARLAAHERLMDLDTNEATALAEKYQLLTNHTSYILVKMNDSNSQLPLPQLQQIPHHIPAGQSGFGRIIGKNSGVVCQGAPLISSECLPILDYLTIPMFLRKQFDDTPIKEHNLTRFQVKEHHSLAESLNSEFNPNNNMGMSKFDIYNIEELGEKGAIIEILYQLEHAGYNEQKLVAAWLSLYNEFNPDNKFSRHVTRLIRVLCKDLDVSAELINNVREAMKQELALQKI